jgi:hypothetical protein
MELPCSSARQVPELRMDGTVTGPRV